MNETNPSPGLVHVVDDDEDLRNSMEWTLRSVGYEVQSHATAQAFLNRADPTVPCCLVVDLLLPGMTGLDLCQELAASHAACAVVMISGHGDLASAVDAMKLGAVDFLEKPCSRQKLLRAVQEALNLAQRRQREIAEEDAATSRFDALTPREREIFEMMAAGLLTKDAAAGLGLSSKTVGVHRARIMQKLGVDSPTQLAHLINLKTRRQMRESRSNSLKTANPQRHR